MQVAALIRRCVARSSCGGSLPPLGAAAYSLVKSDSRSRARSPSARSLAMTRGETGSVSGVLTAEVCPAVVTRLLVSAVEPVPQPLMDSATTSDALPIVARGRMTQRMATFYPYRYACCSLDRGRATLRCPRPPLQKRSRRGPALLLLVVHCARERGRCSDDRSVRKAVVGLSLIHI